MTLICVCCSFCCGVIVAEFVTFQGRGEGLIRSLATNHRRPRRRHTERTVLAGCRIITEYPQSPIEAMALRRKDGDWARSDWIAGIGVLLVLVVVLVWSITSSLPLLLLHAFAQTSFAYLGRSVPLGLNGGLIGVHFCVYWIPSLYQGLNLFWRCSSRSCNSEENLPLQ